MRATVRGTLVFIAMAVIAVSMNDVVGMLTGSMDYSASRLLLDVVAFVMGYAILVMKYKIHDSDALNDFLNKLETGELEVPVIVTPVESDSDGDEDSEETEEDSDIIDDSGFDEVVDKIDGNEVPDDDSDE